MILYINNMHCTSLGQLRNILSEQPLKDDVYWDILDYGRNGKLSQWLQNIGEKDLSVRLDCIESDLSDSAFFTEIGQIFLDKKMAFSFKPDVSYCFNVENVRHKVVGDSTVVFIYLKVLLPVNEEFGITVQTNLGNQRCFITPYKLKKGGVIEKQFYFKNIPDKEIDRIDFFVDEILLSSTPIERNSNKRFYVKNIGFNMIFVEHGTFMKGATEYQKDSEESEYYCWVHKYRVILTKDYYIGETQVTQKLWTAVMGSNPSRFKGDKLPVENVSWKDIQDFIRKLNKITKQKFRLPTEAEWEFAARGGNNSNHTRYSGGDIVDDVAWYEGNSRKKTHPVAQKQPNELGIYDMNGNVWECCSDYVDHGIDNGNYNEDDVLTNPTGPKKGDTHICRGGGYEQCKGLLEVDPDDDIYGNEKKSMGLRLCLSSNSKFSFKTLFGNL